MKKISLTKLNYDYLYYIKVTQKTKLFIIKNKFERKKINFFSSSYNIFLKYLGFYHFRNFMFPTLTKEGSLRFGSVQCG